MPSIQFCYVDLFLKKNNISALVVDRDFIFFPAFSLYGIYEQVMLGNPIGDKPLSDEGVISFSILVGLGLPVLFWFMKLKLRVSQLGLHYQFFPVHFKERRFLLKTFRSLQG